MQFLIRPVYSWVFKKSAASIHVYMDWTQSIQLMHLAPLKSFDILVLYKFIYLFILLLLFFLTLGSKDPEG